MRVVFNAVWQGVRLRICAKKKYFWYKKILNTHTLMYCRSTEKMKKMLVMYNLCCIILIAMYGLQIWRHIIIILPQQISCRYVWKTYYFFKLKANAQLQTKFGWNVLGVQRRWRRSFLAQGNNLDNQNCPCTQRYSPQEDVYIVVEYYFGNF